MQLAERGGQRSGGRGVVADVEDGVDEVTDAAAVLFASGEQGGDGVVPLVVVEGAVVEEGAAEVADGATELVEGERSVAHQNVHPVVGRVAGSSPTPWW